MPVSTSGTAGAPAAHVAVPPEVPSKDEKTGSLSDGGGLRLKKSSKRPLSSIFEALAVRSSVPPALPRKDGTTATWPSVPPELPPKDSDATTSSLSARSGLISKKASRSTLSSLLTALTASSVAPPVLPPKDATTRLTPSDRSSLSSEKHSRTVSLSNLVAAFAASASAPVVPPPPAPEVPPKDAKTGLSSDGSDSGPDRTSRTIAVSTLIAALATSASVPVVPCPENPVTLGSSKDWSSLKPRRSPSKAIRVLSNARSLFIDDPDQLQCVVCKVHLARGEESITCSLACIRKFCEDGPADPATCDVCYRLPSLQGKRQCGRVCAETAKLACLLCRFRPKNGRHDFCSLTCRGLSLKLAPLILKVPKGHITYDMVERIFKNAWKAGSSPIPAIKSVYKVIETEEFHRPYDLYRERIGPEECYRYHGTTRQCGLGVSTKTLCTSSTCPLCNILKTSYKVDLAKPSGAFGKGVYTSSASNKAFSYCKEDGALLLNKVVLGRVRQVHGWNEVMSCPPGYDSVVFDRFNGSLNETIFYCDDAIRPVFLIMFK